jgi:hypothetical protein
MVCEEKIRLLDEYTATTSVLFAAMTTLHGKAGEEFCKALTASKAARAKCVKARLALRDHKARCEACESVGALKPAGSRRNVHSAVSSEPDHARYFCEMGYRENRAARDL